MKVPRRILLSVPAVIASLVFTQGAVLAQAPGVIPAGQYHNSSNQAGFFATSASGDNLSVQVIDSTGVASPHGGPTTTTHTTVLNIEVFGSTFGNGCYDIAASDFTFSISAAALHTTVTDSTPTCGFPGSFATPFTVDITWTGTGPVSSGRHSTNLSCGAYGLDEAFTNVINAASGVASFSPIFPDQFTAPKDQLLRTDDERIHAHGPSPESLACQPAPGIPGGAGPPPAGDYRSSSTEAGFDLFNDTTGQDVGVFVTRSTQTSSPKGAPSTTTTDFNVRINVVGGGSFFFGCFVLTPADFSSSGVVAATLSTTITVDTPTCQPGFPGTLPLPLTVSVVWTGYAPVGTTRGQGSFTCLTYHSKGTSLDSVSLANVTATLSPLLTSPITTNQGSLVTRSSSVHAEGAQQPACHL
jgi:hypothetical protein